jgi:N-acetylglucosamine kinase-like BadF-type ATPase
VTYAWTKRGPATALTDLFIRLTGARDLEDLLEGYTTERFAVSAEAAPAIFQIAEAGDPVARGLIAWAGTELAEMACAVIRQLGIQNLAFDVVEVGSMFEGGPLLTQPLQAEIHKVAPKARLVRLNAPPVLGAVVIGMNAAGLEVTPSVRQELTRTLKALNGHGDN